jgi:hypothetical protein
MRFAEWTQRYGGVYKIRFFYAFGVVVTDPQLVRAILQVWGERGVRERVPSGADRCDRIRCCSLTTIGAGVVLQNHHSLLRRHDC